MLPIFGKLDALINSAKIKTENFYYGRIYPVFLALAVFLFWILNLQMVGFALVTIIGSFALIAYNDLLPTIPALLTIPMTIRKSTVFDTSIMPYIILIPAVIAFIVHNFRYKWVKPKFDALFFGLIGVTVALLAGGIGAGYAEHYKYGISFVMIAGVAMLAVHFFYTNRIKLNDKCNQKKYLAFSVTCVGNLACVQLIYALISVKLYGNAEFIFPTFCWANTNSIGYIILIATPMCAYLALDAKWVTPYAINVLFYYACAFLTESDGATFILIALAPVLLYVVIKNATKKNYQTLKLIYMTVIPLIFILVASLFLFNFETIKAFLFNVSNDNGRSHLYQIAWELFIKAPIFGAGVGHGYQVLNFVNFHSTIYSALAYAGVIGLLAYVVLYLLRIRLIHKNHTVLGIFSMLSFVAFGLYSLIDTGEFFIVLLYITVIITVTGVTNRKGNDDPLPLTKKFTEHELSSNVDFV